MKVPESKGQGVPFQLFLLFFLPFSLHSPFPFPFEPPLLLSQPFTPKLSFLLLSSFCPNPLPFVRFCCPNIRAVATSQVRFFLPSITQGKVEKSLFLVKFEKFQRALFKNLAEIHRRLLWVLLQRSSKNVKQNFPFAVHRARGRKFIGFLFHSCVHVLKGRKALLECIF